jgi:hypothetical protein
LIRTSVVTALSESVVPSGGVTSPVMVAGYVGTSSTASSTSDRGPPVSTGTGSGVAYPVAPSTIVANNP